MPISGGYADDATDQHKQGGGLQNGYYEEYSGVGIAGGTFVVNGCKFEDNYAEDKGGAVMTRVGTPSFTDCEFDCNETGDDGKGSWS